MLLDETADGFAIYWWSGQTTVFFDTAVGTVTLSVRVHTAASNLHSFDP
jgi:hypothetical protein